MNERKRGGGGEGVSSQCFAVADRGDGGKISKGPVGSCSNAEDLWRQGTPYASNFEGPNT